MSQTDGQTDDIITPIADHTVCAMQQYDRLKLNAAS